VGPAYQFFVRHRYPFGLPRTWKRDWAGVWWTNLGIAATAVAMASAIGWGHLLAVEVPLAWMAVSAGVWLFYVQHQFEETYWVREGQWNHEAAGLDGSSYLDLPPLLHWCTGNIGFHHVHHLAPRIPNYRLARCFAENPGLWSAHRLTLADAVRALRFKLWDESRGRLIAMSDLQQAA
jgi:omega-6 fatty acid desaturase (delta-12 desaturase)